nr:hypothetical protein [Limnoglobus roseus]
MQMTACVRGLLLQGNQKLGSSIHHFDLPAVVTCPGRSPVCESACYCRRGRYLFKPVKDRLAWNYDQSQRDDFVKRVIAEVRSKGVIVLRAHCSGDLYSKAYAEKWLAIMRACPKVRFYLYTRSHRIDDIAPVLAEMAQLRQARIWYSIDGDTGVPASIPPGVRLAYLQVGEDEQPELVDLLFRVRRLRKKRIPLSVLCPNEGPSEKAKDVNCGNCRKCWE